MVLCGHFGTECPQIITAEGNHGNTVYQVLVNPQDYEYVAGAVGAVCMLYFSADGSTFWVEYYSTYEDKYYDLTPQPNSPYYCLQNTGYKFVYSEPRFTTTAKTTVSPPTTAVTTAVPTTVVPTTVVPTTVAPTTATPTTVTPTTATSTDDTASEAITSEEATTPAIIDDNTNSGCASMVFFGGAFAALPVITGCSAIALRKKKENNA